MYHFIGANFLGEVQKRLKKRKRITFTKPDVVVTYQYTNYPKNYYGEGESYSDKPALEMMVWWKGQSPRYTNWH